jgi:hypothetical protein
MKGEVQRKSLQAKGEEVDFELIAGSILVDINEPDTVWVSPVSVTPGDAAVWKGVNVYIPNDLHREIEFEPELEVEL